MPYSRGSLSPFFSVDNICSRHLKHAAFLNCRVSVQILDILPAKPARMVVRINILLGLYIVLSNLFILFNCEILRHRNSCPSSTLFFCVVLSNALCSDWLSESQIISWSDLLRSKAL